MFVLQKTPNFEEMLITLRLIILYFGFLFLIGQVFAQAPAHDECYQAKDLPENEWLEEDNYQASLSPENTRPPRFPATCIQTYENDLWYRFETQGFAEYQITIVHNTCNTPAGLQALLIQGAECDTKKYSIQACSNRKIADTIKLFFSSPKEPQSWLLYVDGYDGTLCSYDLQLKKAPGAAYSMENLAYNKFYTDTNCTELPLNLNIKFENNKPILKWQDAESNLVNAYLIERVFKNSIEKIGVIIPEPLAVGYQESFQYIDKASLFDEGSSYTYRISRIDKEGNRTCSEKISGLAQVTREFFVTEPIYSGQPGFYKVSYFNRKKQDYTLAILDEQYSTLKSITIKKLEIGESISQLDLSSYPPGVYYFRMSNGKIEFVRKIEKIN